MDLSQSRRTDGAYSSEENNVFMVGDLLRDPEQLLTGY